MPAVHVKACKVCNSIFRERIESLSLQGFNPQRIYDYMQSLQDPGEQQIVQREDIKPSSIRRHLDNHFDREETIKVKSVETQDKIEQSRDMLHNGITIAIDKVNSLCHMIDVSLLKLEEIDNDGSINNKTKYTLTVSYMNTAKGLIESLAKLTGELKQEGTIDINFFSNEIATFADIVLQSIRSVDKKLQLEGQLEVEFSTEFKAQWDAYKQKQIAVINGESRQVVDITNKFNDGY